MSRMRRVVALTGVALLSSSLWAGSTTAALIKPEAGRAYPDIAADINGTVSYTYNGSTETGLFQVTNTPYLMAGGPTSALEFAVNPDASGLRQQMLSLNLDKTGALIAGPTNTYALYGSIVSGGETYTGLLLSGTPTAFGFQDLDSVGINAVDVFDVNVQITGGAMADFFGSEAYIRITPELESTFHGSFVENFSAQKATSNTRTYSEHQPFPVPEPTTLVVLALGGLGMIHLHRRRQRTSR